MVQLNVSLTILIFAHLVVLAITVAQLLYRYSRYFIWLDDIFAGLAVIGNLVVLERLATFVVGTRSDEPIHYRVELVAYFSTLWLSRSSLSLSGSRVEYFSSSHTKPARIAASSFVVIAIIYAFVAIIFCTDDWGCTDNSTCLCYPPQPFMIFSLFSDILADVGLIVWNWNTFMVNPGYVRQDHSSSASARAVVIAGVFSNLLILVSCVSCFISFSALSKDRVELIFLINIEMITAVFAANFPVMLHCFYRMSIGSSQPRQPQSDERHNHNTQPDSDQTQEDTTSLPKAVPPIQISTPLEDISSSQSLKSMKSDATLTLKQPLHIQITKMDNDNESNPTAEGKNPTLSRQTSA